VIREKCISVGRWASKIPKFKKKKKKKGKKKKKKKKRKMSKRSLELEV
jgi:hypothetical protein